MKIIYLSFFLRVLIAYAVVFIDLPGTNADALLFHDIAFRYANKMYISPSYDETSFSYSYVLGFIYKYTFDHILFGNLLNVFLWLLSAIILKNCFLEIRVNNTFAAAGLFFYSFLPTGVIFTSVTLRESAMLLLTNIFLYFAIKIYTENRFRNFFIFFIFAIFTCFLLYFLHRAYVIASPVLLIFLFCIGICNKKLKQKYFTLNSMNKNLILIIFFGLFFLYFNNFANFFNEQLIKSENYRFHTLDSRTSYYDFSISENTLISSFMSLVNYFIQPTLNNVYSYLDLVLSFENLLKILLIIYFIINFSFKKKYSALFFLLCLCFLSLSFIWAMGTTNFGTGARHAVPQLGLLTYLVFGYLGKKSKKI